MEQSSDDLLPEIDEPLTLSLCSSDLDISGGNIEDEIFSEASIEIEEPHFTSTPNKKFCTRGNGSNSETIDLDLSLPISEIESIDFEQSSKCIETETEIEILEPESPESIVFEQSAVEETEDSEVIEILEPQSRVDLQKSAAECLETDAEPEVREVTETMEPQKNIPHGATIYQEAQKKKVPPKKKASATDLYGVKQIECCDQKCLKEMDLVEMCLIRKDFDDLNFIQKRQSVLDYLWSHIKPSNNNIKDLYYYLSGFKLCMTAYCLVLGMSEVVVKDCIRDFQNGKRELVNMRSSNLTEKRLHAEIWIHQYVKRVGDKMPDTGTVHLPSYLDKKLMYDRMVIDMEEEGKQCVHYSSFCHIMRTIFAHVKIPKVNRFTRCDYCTVLSEEKRKARDKDVKKYLDNLFVFHNNLQMSERKVYYKHRSDAKREPQNVACILLDGMDQAKLLLPRLSVVAHAYANARQLRTHLIGVLNHGRQPKGYFDLFQYPHDSNLTINVLLLELQGMDSIPDTLYLQMDNCWRENKNQFVLNFLAILVKFDIFKKVNVNFLMVGHTHEDVDQLFNRLSEYITKRNTRSLSELKNSLENCYTPAPKSITLKAVYLVKEWFAGKTIPLHNIFNPHAFKIVKAPSGNVVMQYKNWASQDGEEWKPEGTNKEEWLTLITADTDINVNEVPEMAVPNLEKVELSVLRNDIEKFFVGSRVFTEELKEEWRVLLADDNKMWVVPDRPATWPLQDIFLAKQRQNENRMEEATAGFLGERPAGVPEDIDEMVQNQIAQIPEVYTGNYRRPINVAEVQDYSGVTAGMNVAVNLSNYKPPNIGKVITVMESELQITWMKGGYYRKWVEDRVWGATNIPKESVIYYDFAFDENGKLPKEAAKFLRRRYKSLEK